MTGDEKAWCEEVHRRAMEVYGICGLIDLRAPEGSPEQTRGKRAALAALALAQDALSRINAAGLAADAAQVQAAGYDLAALATAPASPVKE